MLNSKTNKMNSNTFSFLENIELSEVSPKQQGRAKRADSNPTDADIRLFYTGEIYPSVALIEEFSLEYQAEGSEDVQNGFDLIDSKFWGMLPEGTPRFLAIATVSKQSARKPMLFGKSRLKDGKVVNPVAEQGSTTSGKLLIAYLETVLGFTFKGESYIDLNIIREHKIASANGIYLFPYTINKGAKAGTIATVRRENCEVYPLVIATELESEVVEELPQEEVEN